MEPFVQTNIRIWQMLCCMISAGTAAIGAGVCYGERNQEKCLSEPIFPTYTWHEYNGVEGQYFVLISAITFFLISTVLLIIHLIEKWIDQKLVALICLFGTVIMLISAILEMCISRSFLTDPINVSKFLSYAQSLSSVIKMRWMSANDPIKNIPYRQPKVHPTVHSWVASCAFSYVAVLFYFVDFLTSLRSAIREHRLTERRRESLKRKSNTNNTTAVTKSPCEVKFAVDVTEKIIED